MIWLGDKRGYLSDWITQLWVRATGRRVDLDVDRWLDGPRGLTRGIGREFFFDHARALGLTLDTTTNPRGILPNFGDLRSGEFSPAAVAPAVIRFYENTSGYELEAWSEWHRIFRPFGWLLAILFSRRLQQLNVPLSNLDTSRGLTNEVLHFRDQEGHLVHVVWLRQLAGSGHVLYSGSYTTCKPPGYAGTCLKVVFPLPNGNAVVIMRPEAHDDGSVSLVSSGTGFGSPGFYFVVHRGNGRATARYVRTMQERITVYPDASGEARADHVLRIWRRVFLRLHYRLRLTAAVAQPGPG